MRGWGAECRGRGAMSADEQAASEWVREKGERGGGGRGERNPEARAVQESNYDMGVWETGPKQGLVGEGNRRCCLHI